MGMGCILSPFYQRLPTLTSQAPTRRGGLPDVVVAGLIYAQDTLLSVVLPLLMPDELAGGEP